MQTTIRPPKNRLPKILTAALLGSALCIAAPVATSAHTPAASPTCSTLNVELQSYVSSDDAPTPNSVTVVIDGTEIVNVDFGRSYSQSFLLGDESVAHTWSVVIDAVDNGYDATLSGTTTPCGSPLPRDASAATTLSEATCTTGELPVLGAVANAVWGELEVDADSYSVTATAIEDHLFDDGLATRTFTGPLAPPLAPWSTQCAPAPTQYQQSAEYVDCDTATVTTSLTLTTIGWVYDDASGSWIEGEPTSEVTTDARAASEEECGTVAPTPPTTPGTEPEVGSEVEPEPEPVVEPVVEEPQVAGLFVDSEPQALAHTGTDAAPFGLAALVLLGLGLGLARRGRTRMS